MVKKNSNLFVGLSLSGDDPVQESPQQLISARLVVSVVAIPENGIDFAFGNCEVHQFQGLNYICIFHIEGYS